MFCLIIIQTESGRSNVSGEVLLWKLTCTLIIIMIMILDSEILFEILQF